ERVRAIALGTSAIGEENPHDLRRKGSVVKDLGQVVDEMGEGEASDLLDLFRPRRRKAHVFDRQPESIAAEESLIPHPCKRRLAQVHAGGIEVSVFGFVADDRHLVPRGPGAAQEGITPLEHDRAADPAAVDRALQTLPRLFALRQSPDGPAQLVLAAAEIRTDQPALASERAEDLVVI